MNKVSSRIVTYVIICFIVSCNMTTAYIDNPKICTSLTDTKCSIDIRVINTITSDIFASCDLKNATENTEVFFKWYYYGQQEVLIDSVSLSSGNNIGTLNLQSSLSKPTNGWPKGKYKVLINIVGFYKEPIIKEFTIE